jgi:hypothetical protein
MALGQIGRLVGRQIRFIGQFLGEIPHGSHHFTPICSSGMRYPARTFAQPSEKFAINPHILNVRSINIAEIALDFNGRMRS